MTLTPMQEKFAQLLAAGVNQSDAYRQAGYGGECSPSSIHVHAHDLAHHAKVMPRVEELRERSLALTDWDRAKTVREAATNLKQARELNQIAAANGALGHIIDVQGLKVSKMEANVTVTHHVLPNFSDEQLRELVSRAEQLALEQGLTVIDGAVASD